VAWVRGSTRGARLPRHLRGARAPGARGPCSATRSTSSRGRRTAGRGRRGGGALPDVQRLSSARGSATWRGLRRGASAWASPPTRGAGRPSRCCGPWPRPTRWRSCGGGAAPAQLLWLATEGSARALHLGGVVGRLAPGAEADLVVLDLASTPAIAQRAARAEGRVGGAVPHDHDGRRPGCGRDLRGGPPGRARAQQPSASIMTHIPLACASP
jgi:hypothetical protein